MMIDVFRNLGVKDLNSDASLVTSTSEEGRLEQVEYPNNRCTYTVHCTLYTVHSIHRNN